MMRYRAIPVRTDDRRVGQPEIDTTAVFGAIFWMGLVGLAVIAAVL